MLFLELPAPPTANTYYRNFRGRMVISKRGRSYRDQVRLLFLERFPLQNPMTGRLKITLDYWPPDKRTRDIDNIQKPVLDSLNHAGVFEDDRQAVWLLSRKWEKKKNGRLIVRVEGTDVGEFY